MKALVKKSSEPGLWLEDVLQPEMGINDVLIRVLRTAICGTDMHIYHWNAWAQKTIPVPMIVGHEFVGEIVAVISDELNHASIIDGIRFCKARCYRYHNNDMADLEEKLKEADRGGARFKLISTDGVFSMNGYISRLDEICDLADKYDALVHFDDAHATGFIGKEGRGTHEYRDCVDRVDITTGTLGKALGGASGGYTSARKEIVALLRQRSRPYLFSNSATPPVVSGALKALELVTKSPELRDRLKENTRYFRCGLERMGFDVLPGEHPIIAVMIYAAAKAVEMAEALLTEGVYVIAFSYPVVPQGKARIRIQMSAGLSRQDLEQLWQRSRRWV